MVKKSGTTAEGVPLEIRRRVFVKRKEGEEKATIRWFGIPKFKQTTETWVGLEVDQPTGKNDGEVKGHRYFGPRKANCGVFVKHSQIVSLIQEEETKQKEEAKEEIVEETKEEKEVEEKEVE